MTVRNGLLFLAIFLQFMSGCQIQPANSKDDILPTTIKEILLTSIVHTEIESTNIPAETNFLRQSETNAREATNTALHIPITTGSSPEEPISNQETNPPIEERINRIIAQSGGRWHIIIKEVDDDIIYSRLPEQRINIASVVKVPFALLFFEALKEKGFDIERKNITIEDRIGMWML